jgi:hypothetical protein
MAPVEAPITVSRLPIPDFSFASRGAEFAVSHMSNFRNG